MTLGGSDRRIPRLAGSDRRIRRLVGADRLAPLPVLLSGALSLPALRLAGGVSPEVALGGMPSGAGLELAGAVTPVVELAGPLVQGSLELAGGVAPAAALGGAMQAPSLQLAGAVAPSVPLGGAMQAPSLQLSGGVAPSVSLSAALGLPTLGLSGGLSPAVALGGAMQAPSLQLAGAVAPSVPLGGAMQAPSLQLSGGVAPSVIVGGSLPLPSLQLSGGLSPSVSLSGALALPSLQLSGGVASLAGPLGAWLSLQASTPVGAEYPVWVDVLNANPTSQADTDRRPAAVTSSNGYPLARFDATQDDVVWPLTAQNNAQVTWGIYFRFVPASITGLRVAYGVGTPTGASANKLQVRLNGAKVSAFIYQTPSLTRELTTTPNVLSIGVPVCIGVEFNGNHAAEANKCTLVINGVAAAATLGDAGVMPAALQAATGTALIGAAIDADSGGYGIEGDVGPDVMVFNGAMAGVTNGILLPADRLRFASYLLRPTV